MFSINYNIPDLGFGCKSLVLHYKIRSVFSSNVFFMLFLLPYCVFDIKFFDNNVCECFLDDRHILHILSTKGKNIANKCFYCVVIFTVSSSFQVNTS